ncbi:MAG TPA: hydantoinase/oxoprolinase family protein [Pirellulaceae bacterium]|nr:hydantoinase/oxoprolinase family protein [Pirellulaceae bacterium]
MNWLALDIGGANLKAADGKGFAESYAFALWKEPNRLAQELRTIIAEAPMSDHLAVTMTGELADCFESKAVGVQHILKAVQQASDGRHTRVYLTDGMLVSTQVAMMKPLMAAASNWHALARFCGRYAPTGSALLVDIGSTTSDIIPLVDGQPVAVGSTDTERLLSRELVYTGVERSPLSGLVQQVPYRGQQCPIALEFFATTRDLWTILGELPEDPNERRTADGRPATKGAARARMGRLICADDEAFNHRDAAQMAEAIAATQTKLIASAIQTVCDRLPSKPATVVLSGHGEFLARRALEELQLSPTLVSLARELRAGVSRSAPAHALAVLAREAVGA